MIPSLGLALAISHVFIKGRWRELATGWCSHSVEKAVRGWNPAVCMTAIMDATIEIPPTMTIVRSPSCHAGMNWIEEPVVCCSQPSIRYWPVMPATMPMRHPEISSRPLS